jgi:drug/metabolite transporter (DMT)-like permease
MGEDNLAALALAVTVLTWSSAFPAIRVAVRHFSPAHITLIRHAIASTVLAGYCRITRRGMPRTHDIPGMLVLGSIGLGLYGIALGYGQRAVSSATASFLVASAPLWMGLMGFVFLKDRVDLVTWAGLGISFAGVFAMAKTSGGVVSLNPSAIVVVGAALCQALYSTGQRRYVGKYDPVLFTAVASIGGVLFSVFFSSGIATAFKHAPLASIVSIAYLGLFPSVLGYAGWAYAARRTRPGMAASSLYLIPIVSTLLAWIGLGEVPTVATLGGGIMVIAGVSLVNSRGARPRTTLGVR